MSYILKLLLLLLLFFIIERGSIRSNNSDIIIIYLRGWISYSHLYFSSKHLVKHSKITHQAPYWPSKGGRDIFLEEKVSNPGKEVVKEKHKYKLFRVLGYQPF